jgi:acyl-CoA synthetase (AMP-forming)/AMP-acid ligase II
VLLPHHPALYSSFLGAMECGAVPTFLPLPSHKQDPDLYWQEQRALFTRIGARVVITTAAVAADAAGRIDLNHMTVVDADDVLASRLSRFESLSPAADDIALLQHSSGTTGLKKGVALSHRAVLNQVDRYASAIGWAEDEVVVSWLPLYHDMGLVATFLLPAICGGTLVAMDPFEWVAQPSMQLNAIERFGGTRAWLPNFAFLHLARQAEPDRQWSLATMKSWVNCSEPCKSTAFDRFIDRFADSGVTSHSLRVCYAMAETVFAVSQAEASRSIAIDGHEVMSCGRPLPGTWVRVDAADGEVGEVLVRSESLFDGYFQQPALTRERLSDGWFRTGDLGLIRDGELYITGRRDDLIVVRGRNYYAHHLEAIASDTVGVAPGRVVAFRVFNDDTGTHDIVVVAEGTGSVEARLVERAVRQRVQATAGVLVQRVRVVPRGSLIKTSSGKISRRHNAERFGAAA